MPQLAENPPKSRQQIRTSLSSCQKVRTSCSKFVTTLTETSDLLQGCPLTTLIQTKLTTRCCNNIFISWLCRSCWNNLVTSQIVSSSMLQVFNNLFQQLAVQTQPDNSLRTDLLRLVCRLVTSWAFSCVYPEKTHASKMFYTWMKSRNMRNSGLSVTMSHNVLYINTKTQVVE